MGDSRQTKPVEIAAFDFDGTCISGNSPVILVSHLVSIAPFVIRNLKLNLLTIHHARTDKKRDSVWIEASAKTHF